uniref:Uncharacterized protein n=1 Tax=viral metagenome TaxID=1070528 RepID=A0A6M3LL86_9ZZZZ
MIAELKHANKIAQDAINKEACLRSHDHKGTLKTHIAILYYQGRFYLQERKGHTSHYYKVGRRSYPVNPEHAQLIMVGSMDLSI